MLSTRKILQDNFGEAKGFLAYSGMDTSYNWKVGARVSLLIGYRTGKRIYPFVNPTMDRLFASSGPSMLLW